MWGEVSHSVMHNVRRLSRKDVGVQFQRNANPNLRNAAWCLANKELNRELILLHDQEDKLQN